MRHSPFSRVSFNSIGAIAFATSPTRAWTVAVAWSPCSETPTRVRSVAVPEVCSRMKATQLDVFSCVMSCRL